MTSSKYIQISDKILIEFEYFNEDQASKEDKKEFQIPFYGGNSGAMLRTYTPTGNTYLYYENLIKNCGNFSVENNFYCNLSSPSNAYTCRDGHSNYTTGKYELLTNQNYTEPTYYIKYSFEGQIINCDKVKVYFSGTYNPNNDGRFTLTISTLLKNKSKLILGNYFLTDTKDIVPFLIGERLYTRVAEFYVPSVYSIKHEYEALFGELDDSSRIEILLSTISKESKQDIPDVNGIEYTGIYYLIENAKTAIATSDDYATVYANIKEIDDYFCLQGDTINTTDTFSDFINNLPGSYADYILMHDISVNELIITGYDDEDKPIYTWSITTHNVLTQTDDFDEPVLFRPVLKYSNAVACNIDYILRIYCKSENTQIIKRATYQDFNYLKYGKKMIKINLGVAPTQINVYNKLDLDSANNLNLVNSNASINVNQERIFKTAYITSYRDRINIKASIAPVAVQDIVEDVKITKDTLDGRKIF